MNCYVKLRAAAAALALSCVVGGGVAVAADAIISVSADKQTIRGFGGMNHPAWVGDLTAAQRATVFGNGDNQLGFTVLRIPVPETESTSGWSNLVETAKYAYERGHIVFASPWNPPSTMTETFNRNGNASAKRLKAGSYAAYATHLNNFVTYMKNQGAPLSAISVQNEPDYAEEWTWWTASEIVTFLKNNAASINCKIIAPESFQYVKSMSDPILNDAQALANVDIIGAHLYGTQVSNFPYALFKSKGAGKELWMTEVYHPNSEANSSDKWPEALDVAQHVHNAMVEAEFQMYVWWYIRRSYSPLKEDGTIGKRGWMMAHFSKFVRPGYVRVDANKNPETNVFVSAYKGDGKVVIVAVNKKTSASNMNFTVSGAAGTVGGMESWRTSGTENMVKAASAIAVSNGAFSATLPAQSVTTFVGALGGTAPTANITCNVNNLDASYVAGSNVPRPNVGCGEGVTAGAASFGINGTEITGWNSPGGTHQLYNSGTRTVVLNSLECGGAVVTPSSPVTCGSFEIVPDPATSVKTGAARVRQPFSVNVKGKTLFITANSPTVVEIYNIKGGKEASVNVSGVSQSVKLSLPTGVYFATARGLRDVRFVVR
jgi:glucuronoarabinoxylan endo-1,4-beta-xylanase